MNDAKITLLIPRTVKNKLDDYTNLATGEISGLGEIQKVQDGVFRVMDVFLYKQKCSAASTSIENADIHEFIVDRLNRGESVEFIKLWWHTHYNFSCFWSSTDEGAIQNIENDYLISIVLNQAGEYKTRIDLFKPFRTTIHDLNVVIEENEALLQKEVLPEEKPLMPLHTVLSTLSMTLGTNFRDISMQDLKVAIRNNDEVFGKIASLFDSYIHLIDDEMKEIIKSRVAARQEPVKKEIEEKVSFAGSHYGGLYSGKDRSDYYRSHSRGKSKWKQDIVDDWDSDMMGFYGYGMDEDFRTALVNDNLKDKAVGAPITGSVSTKAIQSWHKLMGRR